EERARPLGAVVVTRRWRRADARLIPEELDPRLARGGPEVPVGEVETGVDHADDHVATAEAGVRGRRAARLAPIPVGANPRAVGADVEVLVERVRRVDADDAGQRKHAGQ